MGGHPKGLLPAPDGSGPLVVRTARLVTELGFGLVLVGDASPYTAIVPGLSALADEPAGVGPLGGLGALLRAAGSGPAIALACDMPYIASDDLVRLATFAPKAAVCAGRRDDEAPWEPLFARYDSTQVLPLVRGAIARGELSLQALLARAGAQRVPLASASSLDDWDEPADLEAVGGGVR